MALYQDLIMDQIKNIGKPRESKSTTTQIAEPPKEGIGLNHGSNQKHREAKGV